MARRLKINISESENTFSKLQSLNHPIGGESQSINVEKWSKTAAKRMQQAAAKIINAERKE